MKYFQKNITLNTLNAELKRKQIVHMSVSSLRRLLFLIDFKYKKDDNRIVLMEKPHIAGQRTRFLRKYKENLESDFKRDVIFLDETWIFSKRNAIKSWQDGSSKSMKRPQGYDGKRYIVLDAGGKTGFVENSELIFASKSNPLDYHGEIYKYRDVY
ncbi:hypothetical protein Zmor_005917 [Zophobas morio]|uniref:Uncharacterized protein n=1 Tax=Zophobas morio TaxID=2755281 RepID=A0AA38MMV4_9CUCU|nr:hypothetical protein Zmor_005917 [Zophobas morio]